MRATFTTGALAASLAAGPIVSISIVALGVIANPHPLLPTLAYAPFFVLLSMLFGFPISLIPNFAGSALLARLGCERAAFRHPLVWAATGFAVGAAMMTAVTGTLDGASAVLGLVGALCASICRFFTLWDDLPGLSSAATSR